jgi:hypothetical protein
MAKTHNPKKGMTVWTPDICADFGPVHYGDTVQWQNAPSGCIIDQSGPIWPFKPGPPLTFPLPVATVVTINVKPPATQTYPFSVSCCQNEAIKYVTVSG